MRVSGIRATTGRGSGRASCTLVLIGSIALAGLGGPVVGAEPSPSLEAAMPSGLDGTWLITGYQDVGGWMAAPVTTERAPEITFNVDGTFWGHTGCNGFSGQHRVSGAVLETSELAANLQYCGEGDVARQETSILAAVDQAAGWQTGSGSLQLTDAAGAIVLAGAPVGATLVGDWADRVDHLPAVFDPAVGFPETGGPPTMWQLGLAADGSFTSVAGCDPVSGTYALDGPSLRFTVPVVATGCGGDSDPQLLTVDILGDTAAAVVNPYRLTLLDAGGLILAELSVAEDGG